ncbi:class I SAM-dependent methyltransferase [Streptomyces olivaceoviridis]|uniref:class I SAM-dependent methyltransferase n=1 Tax=Streptomyces olivaceoviridis TaxID=1921 RepID=UPI0036A7DF52
MTGHRETGRPGGEPTEPTQERVLAGVQSYSRRMLAVYDLWILGVVCPAVWHCSRRRMARHYDRNVGARHLDIGPGTGYFLRRCAYPTDTPELTLVDLSPEVLRTASARLAKFRPAWYRRDVLRPLDLGDRRFDSAGMNLLLHCLPGGMAHKAIAFDHILPYMEPGGRVFGSTVLAHGVRHGVLAPKALHALNRDNDMDNADDSLAQLGTELSKRFADHRITVHGSMALFEATVG